MCASYGLDPRSLGYADYRRGLISADAVDELIRWVDDNAGETVRPTGKNLRNLNPVFVGGEFVAAWWGQLVGGAPAKFPSINSRLERVADKPGLASRRVVVPASEWYEFQKPSKTRFAVSSGEPFAFAGLASAGYLADGSEYTCYSIITGPAAAHLEVVHDRMPLVLPPEFFDTWLDPDTAGSRALIDAAVDAAESITADFSAQPAPADSGSKARADAPPTLFD